MTGQATQLSDTQVIYLIHHEASRDEIHPTLEGYQWAKKREAIWEAIDKSTRRKVLTWSEGVMSLVDLALTEYKHIAVEVQ